ncbi:MAG: 3-hydroxyacyl-CoA dehydrogenase [Caulobacterales bacterium 32-69-10]|nr:MAG: 3-hydroxyacyl-CoA dehydrogenase [Caulobacterales bacterium 32-69-10]
MENFKIEIDDDGIALVKFNVPGRSMNTITAKVMAELPQLVERLKTDPAIKGAVLTSGKDNGFCAGADLTELAAQAGSGSPTQAFEIMYGLNKSLRGLETCGKPVAAAINGLALGGGFEIVLACHYRVAGDSAKIQLGLPEGKVGLMPGGGGTQRVTRMIGVMAAGPILLESKILRPKDALGQGLINEVVAVGSEVEAAKAWVKAKGDAVQPWDKRDYRLPGGGPYTASGSQVFIAGNAMLRKSTFGNYPAQLNMMKAVYEGVQLPMDAALRVESRYFVKTMLTPQAKGMIRSLFVSMQELGKGVARPANVPPTDIKKVAVLGAGMMGAGIAYVQAMAGIETVLIDVKQEAADKGKAHVEELLKKRVGRGQMTDEKMAATLALVTATTDYALVKGSDLVVEAVFENRQIKAEVTRKAEAELSQEAVFGSNTSTLPITGLAEASARPERFIGVHFFSPVDKMMLVEIIKGEQTGDEATAAAIDYVLKIKKTPIVVHDSRGFYTSRCFMTFLQEGMEMLIEGIAPAIIDNVGRMTGMPRGPLEMTDDVALDLAHKIVEQTAKDLGDAYTPGLMDALLQKLVVDLGRYGRKNGKGFYDYPESGPKRLWPGLSEIARVKVNETDPALVEEIKTRLLYRQAVEAARCFEEGVVTDARDADVGAILGWGFAPWTGGPLSLIDAVGAKAFVETCDRLAAAYGDRFAPPNLLREMAANGGSFYGPEGAARAA